MSLSRRARATYALLFLLVAAGGLYLAVFGASNVPYETPDYTVTKTLDRVELRRYEPYIVAETSVDGDLESAGNRGFRILAKYIFGNNRGDQKIAMTTPVAQEKSGGTKIPMTAPVTQKPDGEAFKIRFMMPSELTLQTLPEPNDERIRFVEVPETSLAALRYSGTWSKRNYEKHLDLLYETLRAHGLEPLGEPVWARYDPPFKPWFMRRNEILTAFGPES
jgi:hypothetical protein